MTSRAMGDLVMPRLLRKEFFSSPVRAEGRSFLPVVGEASGLGNGAETMRRPRIAFPEPPVDVREFFVVCVECHF